MDVWQNAGIPICGVFAWIRVGGCAIPPAVLQVRRVSDRMTLETESAEDVWLRGHDAQVSSIQTAGFPPQNGALFSGYALARTQRLGGVVLDRSGGLLFANSAFSALFGKTPPNVEAALEALTQRRSRMAFSTNDKRLAAIVYAPADQGLTWSLPPEVRQEAQRPDAAILGLAVAGIDGGKALDDACLAL
ncbi:MAG TPA: hypothetical protein PLH31_13975, partial [Caulobacter sp.]|nr:hypothetical protein [Caulobacter sp.]